MWCRRAVVVLIACSRRYEEGDDNMRKIIGEAMLKSKRGEGTGAPDAVTDI
jgi:hypothetical protein